MLPAHLEGASATGGTERSRRKQQRREALQDAALELFAEQGYDATTVDDIAARAKVSAATFFRYFESKSDVLYNDPEGVLPVVWGTLINRPADENDLTALRHALAEAYLDRVDPERARLQARAVATSPLLRGLTYGFGLQWRAVISDALARRRGLQMPDESCELAAAVALTAFGFALDAWMKGDPREETLAQAIDRAFDRMGTLVSAWSGSRARRAR